MILLKTQIHVVSLIIFLVVLSIPSIAQDSLLVSEDSVDMIPDDQVLEEYSDAESDAAQLSETLDEFRRNPIDLNSATQAELEQIPNLSPILVRSILSYREKQRFVSARELLKVEGMTRETFVGIKDFVTVRAAVPHTKHWQGSYRQRTERTLELGENYDNGRYAGNAFQIYNRLNAEYHPGIRTAPDAVIRSGFVLEKDPGESRWNDHQVWFVDARNLPFIKYAVLGNYQLEYGQGIVLWGGSGLSKSTETVQTVKRHGRGVTRYNYATENAALQGGAITLDLSASDVLRPLEVTGFYSYAHFDASYNPDGSVNSILTDGLHRDSNEIKRRDYLLETLGGVNVDYRIGSSSSIGVNYFAHQYDRRFTASDPIRSRYDFAGTQNRMLSEHHDLFFGNFDFFGESALDRKGNLGMNSGIEATWKRIEMVLFYRNYDRDFQSLRGYAFGEQSGRTQNEKGIYTGLKYKPRRGTTIQWYVDIYRYPWRTYDVPQPVQGRDFLTQVEHIVWRNTQLTALYKNEHKDVSAKAEDVLGREITIVVPGITQRWRAQVDQTIVPALRLRTRVEQTRYRIATVDGSAEKGILFYEDARFKPLPKLVLYGRISFFDTKSNTAVYEYENDVEGVFSNARFSGKGTRWYILAKYAARARVQVSAKYWQMTRQNVTEIGTGGDAIQGNTLRKFTLSLDVEL